MSQPDINFAALVKQYRDQLGISQKELADLAHVSRSTIERIEAGRDRTNIKVDTLLRIVLVLSMHIKDPLPQKIDWDKFDPLANILFHLARSDKTTLEMYMHTIPSNLKYVEVLKNAFSDLTR